MCSDLAGRAAAERAQTGTGRPAPGLVTAARLVLAAAAVAAGAAIGWPDHGRIAVLAALAVAIAAANGYSKAHSP
jgi:hypothetical protein